MSSLNGSELLIPFLSLWICLLWTNHLNVIIHSVAFGAWLLSVSIMFRKFTNGVRIAVMGSSLLFCSIPRCDYTTVFHSTVELLASRTDSQRIKY